MKRGSTNAEQDSHGTCSWETHATVLVSVILEDVLARRGKTVAVFAIVKRTARINYGVKVYYPSLLTPSTLSSDSLHRPADIHQVNT